MPKKNFTVLSVILITLLLTGCSSTPHIPNAPTTITSTPKATPTSTETPVPTATDTPIPINTLTPTATNAPTPTNTLAPTATNTPTPTNTPIPTITNTPTPTNTPVPTATNTPTPTNTPIPTATSTPTPTVKPTPTRKVYSSWLDSKPSVTPTATPTPVVIKVGDNAIGTFEHIGSGKYIGRYTYTISGTGATYNYMDFNIPQNGNIKDGSTKLNFNNKVVEIIVEEGITRLGDRTFMFLSSTDKVTLPSTLEEIGYRTFAWTGKEKSQLKINLEETKVRIIGEQAFLKCPIAKIVLPESIERIEKGAFNQTESNKYSEFYGTLILPANLKYFGDNAISSTRYQTIVIKGKKSLDEFEYFTDSPDGLFSISKNEWFKIIFEP